MIWLWLLLSLFVTESVYAVPTGCDAYCEQVLADSPILYLKFNDPRTTDNTLAVDDSGHGHNGTYMSTSGNFLARRQNPPALSLCPYSIVNDTSLGVGERIEVPDFAASHFGTGNWTFEFFYNTAFGDGVGGCGAYSGIFSKGTTDNNGWPNIICGHDVITHDNSISIRIGADTFTHTATYDVFHMYTFVKTGVSTVLWYKDGSLLTTLTLSGSPNATNTDPIVWYYNTAIGGGNTNTYTVKTDDLSLYDTALDVTRVAAHWTAANTSRICPLSDSPVQVGKHRLGPSLFGLLQEGIK